MPTNVYKKIVLNLWQKQVASDPHRFRVVCAGRRAGKSVLARTILLVWGVKKVGNFWIVSPTYKQSKMIHWYDLQKELPPAIVARKNEVELSITLKNGSVISLKGAENPDTLRGAKLAGLIVDEVASIKNWDWLWEEVLRPTLTDTQAPAVFISTPKGYNHFWDLFNKQDTDPDYKSWRFTSYDNPFVPKEELDKAKQELDPDVFAQEYLAEFRKFSGLVFKDFSRDKHVIEPIELPNNWTFYRAIDFGWIHPTAVLFVALSDKGTLYIYDEIYEPRIPTPDLAEMIKQKSLGRMFTQTIGDSAQQADIAELSIYGIPTVPVRKVSDTTNERFVAYKIRKITEKLRTDKLKIFKNCENTICEFENYRYKEVQDASGVKEVPVKLNDHCIDALSYLIVSLPERLDPKIVMEDEFLPELPKENFWYKGFY